MLLPPRFLQPTETRQVLVSFVSCEEGLLLSAGRSLLQEDKIGGGLAAILQALGAKSQANTVNTIGDFLLPT